MIFIDEAIIEVRGGRGGDGCRSFRRERRVPRGGPDGGNGGKGGSVFLCATAQLHTLYDIVHRKIHQAGAGESGRGANRTGADGEDRVIRVPVGTVVRDLATGLVLADLVGDGQRMLAVRGGRYGRGNAAFTSSTNRTPRRADPGEPGEARQIKLELKLLADVGVIGLPNAGKSTFLSAISAARPRIADYPFTTKEPNLGIVALPGDASAVFADLPGLIEGAHAGRGLGHRFLRHVERTRILLHLVDVGSPGADPALAYKTVRGEIGKYSRELAKRPEIIGAAKIELTGARERLGALEKRVGKRARIYPISSATRQGIGELLRAIGDRLHSDRP